MKITSIDHRENDAFLEIGLKKFYFQFPYDPAYPDPTLWDAIQFFISDKNVEALRYIFTEQVYEELVK